MQENDEIQRKVKHMMKERGNESGASKESAAKNKAMRQKRALSAWHMAYLVKWRHGGSEGEIVAMAAGQKKGDKAS